MVVHLAENLAWREVAGSTVIINLDTRRMYELNDSGGRVWKALAEEQETAAITAQLVADESLSGDVASQMATALDRFLAELSQLGLLAGDQHLTTDLPEGIGLPGRFTPPQVVWQEQLVAYGLSCAFSPGQSPICSQNPHT